MMQELIPVKIFEFIVSYKETHDGNTPTYREMLDGVDGVSSLATIHNYLHKMIKSGLINLVDGKICLDEGTWIYDAGAQRGESLYERVDRIAKDD